jgi:short chain dehydrogenase
MLWAIIGLLIATLWLHNTSRVLQKWPVMPYSARPFFVWTTVDRFGRLDVAVNNAGVDGEMVSFAEITPECFAATFDTNVLGTLLSIKHELRIMKPQGSGSIVNLSSIYGQKGNRQRRRNQERVLQTVPQGRAGAGRGCRSQSPAVATIPEVTHRVAEVNGADLRHGAPCGLDNQVVLILPTWLSLRQPSCLRPRDAALSGIP